MHFLLYHCVFDVTKVSEVRITHNNLNDFHLHFFAVNTPLTHSERVKKILEFYKISQSEMGRRIGAHQSNINAIVRERPGGNLSTEMMVAICKSFTEIDGRWLLTGEGEMLRSDISGKKYDPLAEGGEGVAERGAVYERVEPDVAAELAALWRRVGQLEAGLARLEGKSGGDTAG